MSDPFSALMDTPPIFNYWITWMAIAGIAILAGIRSYLRGPQYFSQTPLDGKVAVVTGGNRGIGYHVIKELAKRGAKVYFGCRNERLAKSAEKELRELTKSPDIHYIPLKLGSIKSIKEFCNTLKEKEESIDILVCNAGVMCCPRSKTNNGFEYHLGINYIANYVLIEELKSQIVKSAPSRIILVTSAAFQLGEIRFDDLNLTQLSDEDYSNGSEAFSQSKLALMLLMNKVSRDLASCGVTINAVHPGVVRTDIHRYMPIQTSSFLYVSTLPIAWYLMKSAHDGAQTVNFLCIDEAVKTVTGKYYVDMQQQDIVERASDEDAANKLWELVEGLVHEAQEISQPEAVEEGGGDEAKKTK